MKFTPKVIAYFTFLITLFNCCSGEDPIVETSAGKVKGLMTKTRLGRDIFTFYGIRYAEPPINENRFKPPIPVKKWEGVYPATTKGQACMQPMQPEGESLSEDCLFLDVYSTDLSASRPVIVFIHGGAFYLFSKSIAGPEYLLDKEVVLVSMNYRLGAFGFFSVGTNDASGNQAFKDQLLAMKWVRENIKAFGGNPDLITLSGQSAGSFSVSLHLLSKKSVGLFHRAIGMSGSAVGYIEPVTRRSSNYLIFRTVCFRFSKAKIVECLQQVSAEDIINISKELLNNLPWYYDIENDSFDQPFLTERPVDIARRGEIQKMPIMTGVTLDEFLFAAYDIQKRIPVLLTLFSIPLHDIILPFALMYDHHPHRLTISSTLYSFYLHDRAIRSSNLHSFAALISDALIRHGVHRLVEYTRHMTNVYYYRFDYQSKYSLEYYPDGRPLGVLHVDDLQYVLVVKQIAPVADADDPRNFMIEKMTSWWSKFAETGNPNDASNNATNEVIWEPCDGNAIRAIYINETCSVSSEFFLPEYTLWDSLFPLYDNSSS